MQHTKWLIVKLCVTQSRDVQHKGHIARWIQLIMFAMVSSIKTMLEWMFATTSAKIAHNFDRCSVMGTSIQMLYQQLKLLRAARGVRQ